MRYSYKPTLGVLIIFMITLSASTGIYAILYTKSSKETSDEIPDDIPDYNPLSDGFKISPRWK